VHVHQRVQRRRHACSHQMHLGYARELQLLWRIKQRFIYSWVIFLILKP
jgi:hypothetical protein